MSAFDCGSSASPRERQINFRAGSGHLLPADGVLYPGNPNGTLYAHRADTGEGTTPPAPPLAGRIGHQLLRRLFGYRRPKE